MITARIAYRAARVRAFRSRVAALDAARRGDGAEASRLVADAQSHDRVAEDWLTHREDWQWQLDLEE